MGEAGGGMVNNKNLRMVQFSEKTQKVFHIQSDALTGGDQRYRFFLSHKFSFFGGEAGRAIADSNF